MFDRRRDYGPSVFDVTHNWVTSALYELPFGPDKRRGRTGPNHLNWLLGGWQIGGIVVFRTGFPFSCQGGSGVSIDASANFEEDNCDLVAGVDPNAGPHTLQQWFNVEDFARPGSAEVFGNAGRNNLRGPRFVSFDFSTIKITSFTERFEGFNILNHPIFSTPNNFLDNPAIGPRPDSALGSYAGSIGSTAADNRQLQFGLELICSGCASAIILYFPIYTTK